MHDKDLQEEWSTIKQKNLETRVGVEKSALVRQCITERNQKAAQLKKDEVIFENQVCKIKMFSANMHETIKCSIVAFFPPPRLHN